MNQDNISFDPVDVAGHENPALPRVLLVEDKDSVRLVLSKALTDAGYVVAEAAGGDDALALIGGAARRFDVLLTDVRMPGRFDGFALAAEARAGRPDLPVIYMTGWPEIRGRAAVPGGRDAILRKPFGAREVISAIQQLTL